MGAVVKTLVESIIHSLVDHPEAVDIRVIEGAKYITLEVRAAPEDLGRIIGREGRIVNAIRELLRAISIAEKKNKHYMLNIIQE